MILPAAPRSAAVLISGSGSNLQAIIDAIYSGDLPLQLTVVISNRADAFGLARAGKAGIATECIPNADFPERADFDEALASVLDRYRVDFILLAGFMRILTPGFVRRRAGSILNIHPSLLPRHPGLDTHRRALASGDQWHGCTVHFVTADLDGGPAVIQGRVPVLADDDAERLAARVLAVEHRIYPQAAAWLATGRLEWRNEEAWLDGRRLVEPVQYTRG